MEDVNAFNLLRDTIARTRAAVYAASPKPSKQWDAWFGHEAWLAFKLSIPREHLMYTTTASDGDTLMGVKLHVDPAQPLHGVLLSYRGAPVRKIDLQTGDVQPIIDDRTAMAHQLSVLSRMKFPMVVQDSPVVLRAPPTMH